MRSPDRMPRSGIPAALCLLALSLASCNAGFHRFAFLDADGRGVALRESPGMPKDREGLLDPARGVKESPYYGLVKPVAFGAGEALSLSYASTLASCELTIYTKGKRSSRGHPSRRPGGPPYGFWCPWIPETSSADSAFPRTRLGKAGPERSRGGNHAPGFALEGGVLRLDASIRSIRIPSPAAPLDAFTAELSGTALSAMKDGTWLIRLSPGNPPEGGGSGILDFQEADGNRNRGFSVRSEGKTVDFHFTEAGIGFLRNRFPSPQRPGMGRHGTGPGLPGRRGSHPGGSRAGAFGRPEDVEERRI